MKPYLFSDLQTKISGAELVKIWEKYVVTFADPREVFKFWEAALYVDDAVVPGQPIPITITFSPSDRSLVGDGCHLEIFLEDAALGNPRVFQTPDDGTLQAYSGAPNPFNPFAILELHALIQPPPPLSLLGQHLYRIGDHTLHLELTTNGRNRGPFKNADILTVIPEQVSVNWWKWQNSGLGGGKWKEEYTIAGWCENLSQYSAMTFDLKLEETDEASALREYGPFTVLVDAEAAPGAPRESDLQSIGIIQDWQWLVQGIWAPKGPVGKEFSYQMQFTLHDDWGNDYPAVLSSPVAMVVNVSDTKLGLAQLAFSSNVSAIALGIASGALGWLPPAALALAAAATAATIVAAVAGDKALDPPAPSPRFYEEVCPVKFVLPGEWASMEGRGLEDLRVFFEMVGQLLNDMAALGEIHSRLLGAWRDSSHDGATLQVTSYRRTLNNMAEKVSILRAAAEKAAEAVQQTGVFRSDQFRELVAGKKVELWKNLPTEFKKHGLPRSVIAVAKEWLPHARAAQQALVAPEAVGSLFLMMAFSLVSVIVSTQRSADTLLRTRT